MGYLTKATNQFHLTMAAIFFITMLIIELYVSLLLLENYRTMGIVGVLILVLTIVYLLFALKDRFLNGFEEMIIMGLSAVWVIIFSLSLVF